MSCIKGRTDPDLWEKSKKNAIAQMGGRFSARAMQLAGKLYRDAGGGYCGARTKAQTSMGKWSDEDWTTASGDKACKTVDGKTVCDRYLPRKAWNKLTKAQKAATRRKKRGSSAQFVPNTKKAAAAGASVRRESIEQRMINLLSEAPSLDDLRYGPIQGSERAYTDRPVRRFRSDWKLLDLKPPPSNSSLETRMELVLVQQAEDTLTPELEQRFLQQDEHLEEFFSDFLADACAREGLRFSDKDRSDLDAITSELATISQFYKLKFNRPRPEQIADYYNLPLVVVESEVAQTPAYPSGHSFASRFLARLYGDRYPTIRPRLEALAEDVGQNRIRAGLHFPSDHHAGVYLADAVYPLFED